MNRTVTYPLQFPHDIGSYVLIEKPEDLQEYISDFVNKWGKTEFEFNGNKVTAINQEFQEYKKKQSNNICKSYEDHKNRNFD